MMIIPPDQRAPSILDFQLLEMSRLETPLGPMGMIASDKELYLLDFLDGSCIEKNIRYLRQQRGFSLQDGENHITRQVKYQLSQYFLGERRTFDLPLCLIGSPFQRKAWEALTTIPFGETRSYLQQAHLVGKPKSYRAVASANGANKMAIVLPCHRVIHANGALGGYGGGLSRKQWLINHESKIMKK